MKQIRILIFNLSSLCIIGIVLFTFSRKAQTIDSRNCKEFKDLKNKVYKKECYKGSNLTKMFYVDSTGKSQEVCVKPEKEANIFSSELEFTSFVKNNLEWPTDRDIEGKVYFALLIDEQGNVIEKRVLKGIDTCPECIITASSLIKKLGKWQPAFYLNKPVKSIRYIAIPFK